MCPRYSGGGGGSGDDSLSSSAFVDGVSIRVQLLVSTLIGGSLIAWWSGFNRTLENVLYWARQLIVGLPSSYGELYDLALGIPTGLFDVAYTAAGNSPVLDVLGPFGWPLAMVISAMSLYVLAWTIDNAGVV